MNHDLEVLVAAAWPTVSTVEIEHCDERKIENLDVRINQVQLARLKGAIRAARGHWT